MPESDVDIDTLGTLKFEHFERDSCKDSSSDLGSTASSPSHSTDEFDSPLSSPDQASSPAGYSDCWSSHSEQELFEKVPSRQGKAKRRREVNEHVLKRNERERKRVKLISDGFSTLHKHVMIQPSNRKLPKLQILRRAINYIKAMQKMLEESDMQLQIDNQRKRDVCPLVMQPCQQVCLHEQVRYLYSSMDDRENVHAGYPPTFPTHYLEVQRELGLPPEGMPWLHGYTQ